MRMILINETGFANAMMTERVQAKSGGAIQTLYRCSVLLWTVGAGVPVSTVLAAETDDTKTAQHHQSKDRHKHAGDDKTHHQDLKVSSENEIPSSVESLVVWGEGKKTQRRMAPGVMSSKRFLWAKCSCV